MPIQRTSRLSGTTMRPPDELSCPRCNGLLKFVYTYSEHYCENCRRYPMLEARRKTKEKPTFADLIEALDLPERLANQTLTRVVMMLDDFHELASIQNPVVLEAIGQRCEMHGNVSYIFTGGNLPVMNRFFRERHSPLHDIAEWIDLGPLQDAALERFLIDKFRLAKGRLSKEAADFIIGASGGYPSYVQMIAHEVYHIAESPSMNSVEDGIQAVVMHRSAVYSLLWDSIRSPLHKRYLLAAANEPRVPRGEDFVQRHGLKSRSHVQRTEKQLEAKGVVKKGEIIDPMFVLWLRSHAS